MRRIVYSMTVCDMKKGTRALVLKVEAAEAIRERLRFLGIYKGAKIVLLKISLLRSTYLVQAGSARAALGRDVAAGVYVWRTEKTP